MEKDKIKYVIIEIKYEIEQIKTEIQKVNSLNLENKKNLLDIIDNIQYKTDLSELILRKF